MRAVSVRSMDEGAKGFLLVVMAGFLWALVSPASRILGMAGADMVTVVAVRQAVAALVIGGWLFFFRRGSLNIGSRGLYAMALFALAGPLAANLGFMFSLTMLSVPVGLVVHYTFPLMTSIGALLVLKERPGLFEWIGGGLIVFGLFVSAGPVTAGLSVRGISWGLLSALGMAVQSLFGRRVSMGGKVSPMALLFYSNALGLIWLSCGRWFLLGAPFSSLTAEALAWAIFLGIVASCLAYGLYFEGMKFVTASTASLGVTVEIVGATVLAGTMIGEFPSLREALGCSLVIGAVLLAALGSRRSR